MRSLYKTIYGKISLIFILLIVLLGSLQVFISIRSSVNYVCEASQKLNYRLAENLVDKIQPLINAGTDIEILQNKVADFTAMNPRVEVYLLDEKGKVEVSFPETNRLQRQEVDLHSIKQYLAENAYYHLPMFGEDPLDASRKKVFSAAKVMFTGEREGYLYIILPSAKYELAADGITGSFILETSAVVLLLILVFAAVIGLVSFFFITKRLQEVTRGIRNFKEGTLDQRLPVNSRDEVAELATAFNRMADTIENNVKDLENTDRLRRELVSNISHDLRSPLASVQGYVETVLMKSEMPEDERKKFLEIILKNVRKLNHQVDELFELSKLEAYNIQPHLEAFSLSELAQDVVLKFQNIAEEKHINLLSKLPLNLPFVWADIAMIDRVLSNLIDNAIRYSAEKGKILIELQHHQGSILVLVSDNGCGISQADLPHIFDRFYRVEKSRSRSSGGTGLGLAIVKKILALHNMEIEVESKVGEGTVFHFSLPVFEQVVSSV